MPAIACRYTPINLPASDAFPNGQRVLRPLLRVVVAVASGQSVRCFACLDTGADQCVFPLSFAGLLGLDPETMPTAVTRGVTGEGRIHYADVDISIRFRLGTRITTLRTQTRAGFMEGMDAQGIGLLGQIGFFDKYSVTFNQHRDEFKIHI